MGNEYEPICREAVKNVEGYMRKKGLGLIKRAGTPMSTGYIPEIEASPELTAEEATYYTSHLSESYNG